MHLGCISEKDGTVVIGRRHLSLGPLQRWEELGMNEGRLALERMFLRHELVSNVTSDTEIPEIQLDTCYCDIMHTKVHPGGGYGEGNLRILVDSTRNQTWHQVVS